MSPLAGEVRVEEERMGNSKQNNKAYRMGREIFSHASGTCPVWLNVGVSSKTHNTTHTTTTITVTMVVRVGSEEIMRG
jgi:hypothetical protein